MSEVKIPRFIAEESGVICNLDVFEVVRQTQKAALVKARPVYTAADNCHRCGRVIDNPVSRMVGFGPICCERMGLPRPEKVTAEEFMAQAERILGETVYEIWLPKRYLGEIPELELEGPAGERTAELDGEGWVVLTFPFDRKLVDALKTLPKSQRRFNPATKTWTVSPEAGGAFFALLTEYGFEASEDVVTALDEVIRREGDKAPAYLAERKITVHNGQFFVKWSTDDPDFGIIKDEVRAIRGRRFMKEQLCWYVPASADGVVLLRKLADVWGFNMVNGADKALETAEADTADEAALVGELARLSRATDTAFDAGMEELMPFQKAGVEYALKTKRVMVADEMGLGKTIQALATIRKAGAFPAVVICPASLKHNWKREVERWIPGTTVEVLSGLEANGSYDADVTIINYDLLAAGWDGDALVKDLREAKKAAKKSGDEGAQRTIQARLDMAQAEAKKAKEQRRVVLTDHARRLLARDPKAVVLDEGHYIKSNSSQRSQAAKVLMQGPEYVLYLSGTPMLNRPSELIFPMQALGVFSQVFGNWMSFVNRYCEYHMTPWGADYSGAENLDELNALMRSNFMVRRLKKDVLTDLPPKLFADQYLEIDNRPEYDYAEDELVRWYAEKAQRDEEFLASIADLSDVEAEVARQDHSADAARKAERAEALLRLNSLRRLAAEGKVAASVEWIDNFLSSGEKLVVFAHHRAIVDEIASRFKAPKIMGGMKSEDVEEAKRRFQEDDDCNLIVLNIQAGGVGHTLTAASNVAFVEFPWNSALQDQAIDRTHRIGQTADQVTVWQLIAEDTIEDRLLGIIASKRRITEQGLNGEGGVSTSNVADVLQGLVASRS